MHLKAQQIAVIGICAAVYAVVGRLTDLGLTFLGVAFFPAVVIPAVFAYLYGPWVGGFGAAIGIFIRDVLFHGNAVLSLTAGVPANFIVFFIIGYFASREISSKKVIVGSIVACIVVIAGLLVPTALLPAESSAVTGLATPDIILVFAATVIASFAVIGVVALRWHRWASYAVGAVIGQTIGAALLSATVWAVSPLFLSYFGNPIPPTFILPIFIWTFATEIPFVLLLGPPLISACQKAFPSLRKQSKPKKKGDAID
jgi:hypothetical protein